MTGEWPRLGSSAPENNVEPSGADGGIHKGVQVFGKEPQDTRNTFGIIRLGYGRRVFDTRGHRSVANTGVACVLRKHVMRKGNNQDIHIRHWGVFLYPLPGRNPTAI